MRTTAPLTKAHLEDVARELNRLTRRAVGGVREGLVETLTLLRVDLPPTLARSSEMRRPHRRPLAIYRPVR